MNPPIEEDPRRSVLRRARFAMLRPPDLDGPANERVLRSAQRIRLLVAGAFALALPFAPRLSRAQGVALSAVTILYVSVSSLLEAIAARRPGFPARLLTPFLGIMTITAVIVAVPRVQAAGLFFFVLGIVFYTCVGGLALGLWLSLAVIPCVLLSNALAPARDQLDGFTLVMFSLLVPSLAIIVDRLTGERRRTAVELARLHDALAAVTARPDLGATLHSIAESIGDAIGAAATGVMLREHGDLALAAAATVPVRGMSRNRMEHFTRVDLELGSAGPLGYTIERNKTLVVPNIEHDARFPGWSTPWAQALKSIGCVSLVMVPLHLGGEVIGTISAGFIWRGGLDRADLAFLEEYAERASAVIVRARAYERERAAAAQLAEADRVKSEFLAMVSHELRTPLTAAKGFVDTVLLHWERLPEERRRELLTRASGNADELARLVGQLLDFARVEADRVEVNLEPLSTGDAVGGVVRDLAPVVDGHRVDVDVPTGLMMVADSDAFSRVLVNLLTNAVKFSPPGTRVRIEAARDGEEVVVSVADEGVGIAAEDRARIFDRFYQSGANELSRRGTGIGLAIARRFTELQGGRIWVESEPGRGSTFSFTVPAVATAQRPA